eukprot:c30552_g1_i1 orf=600-2051(+)
MEASEIMLNEQLSMDGVRVTASLSQTGVLQWTGASNGHLVLQDDLLGYTLVNFTIILHTFKLKAPRCLGGRPCRVRKHVYLATETAEAHKLWVSAIDRCLSERPKRLLIFLNPFGGRKNAMKIFEEQVEPLLSVARVAYTAKETQFQLHAKDLVKSMDLSAYDGIVCVSGDGVLVEVLNGLLERTDWAQAIRMPLGVIPAGTGNGVAKSLLEANNEPCDPLSATFAIIRGYKHALDVATVVQGHTRFYSALCLTWGLVADVDIESEKLRWMGSLRNDIYVLIRVVCLRKYHGIFAYVPAPGYEGSGEALHEELDMSFPAEYDDQGTDGNRIWHNTGYLGPTFVPEKNEWRTIRGVFIFVWLQNVAWAAENIMPAPSAKLADGYLDLIVVEDCPRWELLGLLMKMRDGSHVNSKHVKYLKVKAFRLAPGGRVVGKVQGGIIALDGEVLARGHGTFGHGCGDAMLYGPPIQITVEKGLATIFCPQ